MNKKALITGVTGQDGSYLTELLLEKGYQVDGIIRRTSLPNTSRIEHLLSHEKLKLYEADLADSQSIRKIMERSQPDEIYNLAAMSHVGSSFEMPEYTADVTGIAVLRILEATRDIVPKARFYQASSSELFGKAQESPQSEKTPFYPRSPYGIAKLYAYWTVINYREAYGLYACNGILFNHESPRRGSLFVSRKISIAVNEIAAGTRQILTLGNLEAKRDWGYAKDFVEGIHLMLQQENPDDFVLATGRAISVRQFVELAFYEVGIEIEWEGSGLQETGKDKKTGKLLVNTSPQFYRPSEVDTLLGNSLKAKDLLGWAPKTPIEELVRIMVQADAKNRLLEHSC
ncbi:MAG: GDP-mannose 4,6-dehydratase [Chlamydiae bacterium CG10_big_fil_rev_8_21_14_0_10_42_34]|nr:MAG: GDP-mannose 4,6-dehydratase [Chlamydiae bacterium CG10_big_fil_rev_8_21_14_0_10_42_34]